MKSLIIASLVAIALIGCGGKTAEQSETRSPGYIALLEVESTIKSGTVGDYQDSILNAQVAIDQEQDATRKVAYKTILQLHKLAYNIAKCPDADYSCSVNAIATAKDTTTLPIGDPRTEDADKVLGLLWEQTGSFTADLAGAGLD